MGPEDMTAFNQKQRGENVWKILFQLDNQWVLHLKHSLQDKNHVYWEVSRENIKKNLLISPKKHQLDQDWLVISQPT